MNAPYVSNINEQYLEEQVGVHLEGSSHAQKGF